MKKSAFYITTPIYYVNAEPHLGHAYTTIVADVQARFHRLDGYDSFFLTGTDEHGDKIVEAAAENNESPRQFVDRISALFQALWPRLNIEPSRFIRTTEEQHIKVVQRILEIVHNKDDIYFGEYGGYYCTGCERFVLERELVDGLCPDHKIKPAWISEENYFFRMSNYQDWLIDHIKSHPGWIRPERYANEVLAFLKEPLEDLCISRPASRLPWGIPLPFDDRYVTYVWFDALINYLTGVDWPDGERFGDFWPVAWHLIAKDILKPHAIFWPTMLQAAGLPVYEHLNVHGYWNMAGDKMAKSRGNVVRPLDLMDKYGPDSFRYFVMREMSFGLDASFSEEALVARLNGDLANDLGNLFARTTAMIERYNDGVVPRGLPQGPAEKALIDMAAETLAIYREEMGRFNVHLALKAVWEYINYLNKYIVDAEPWVVAKDEQRKPELDRILRNLVFALIRVAYFIWPVMPHTGEEILSRLGVELRIEEKGLDFILSSEVDPYRQKVRKGPALFPRIEDSAKKKAKKKPAPSPEPEEISFEEFARVALRVGRVLDCSQPAGSKKLLLLSVDLGRDEPRQILSGLAPYYTPEELIGKLVLVAANLAPKKMMGLTSHGMLLTAEAGKRVRLIDPPEGAEPGAVVR